VYIISAVSVEQSRQNVYLHNFLRQISFLSWISSEFFAESYVKLQYFVTFMPKIMWYCVFRCQVKWMVLTYTV